MKISLRGGFFHDPGDASMTQGGIDAPVLNFTEVSNVCSVEYQVTIVEPCTNHQTSHCPFIFVVDAPLNMSQSSNVEVSGFANLSTWLLKDRVSSSVTLGLLNVLETAIEVSPRVTALIPPSDPPFDSWHQYRLR